MKPAAGPGDPGCQERCEESSNREGPGNPARACFLCGEVAAPGLETCPACGTSLESDRREGAGQPIFESVLKRNSGQRLPWEPIRRLYRLLSSAGETAVAFSLSPDASFREFRYRGGLVAPIVFSILVGGPSLIVSLALRAVIEEEPRTVSGVWPVLLLLVPPVYVYLRAQVLHLSLVLSGHARAPFAATFRMSSYSNMSVAPLLVLPYVGDVAFLLAGAIVEATGLRHGHRMSVTEAALIELAPATALLIGILAAGALGLLWWSQAGG